MSACRPITTTAKLGFAIAMALLLAIVCASPALAARASVPQPFLGTALWVNELTPLQSGGQLVAEAAEAGARTLYVKAADGSTVEPQFSPALVGEIRAAGVSVCAWTFAYGQDPASEAAAAVAAVHEGAQCLIVDAESPYEKLYGAAQTFVQSLRSQLGADFPIGLASEAEVSEHPKFPYSVFLAPGAFNVVLPQMYWLELGVSVQSAYAATLGGNATYGRPILPVGQLFHSPSPGEVTQFSALAHAYGLRGSSFFDLDRAQPQQLLALKASPRLARKAIVAATLHAGADGDQVVWAQELLNAAGAQLPVGGFFGAQTAHAVASFQRRHHLRASGVLDAATWTALLRYRPYSPSWADGPPDSAR